MPRITPAIAALGGLLALAGCASAPQPTAELAQAHSLVDQAEQSGAPQFASADLAMARSKLQQADSEAKSHPELSMRSAQEATVDARVAIARTNSAKAQVALRDVNAGTQSLRNETDRQGALNDASAPPPNSTMVPPATITQP